MFYRLLELIVWGRKSRTWQRWIYGKQPKAWVIRYGLPVIYLANRGIYGAGNSARAYDRPIK